MKRMDNPEAHKYEQVAAEMAHLIECGTFRPGDRIPSVRQLSRQKKISVLYAANWSSETDRAIEQLGGLVDELA